MRYSGTRSLGRIALVLRPLAVGAAIYSAMVVGVLLGRTAEPAREFLDKLRERKYYDHAQEYLERLPQNALATDDLKKIVSFELGVTLWAEAESLRDATARELKLNAAQQKLNEFLKAQPEHALTPTAQSQLASISVERSTLLVGRADRSPQDKDKLLDEARQMLGQAEKIYTASFEQSRDQLKKLQADTPSTDKEAIAKRDELRREWVQARMKLADIDYQKSKAAVAGTADQKRFLENAAEKYSSLAEDFQNKFVGMQARVLEGVCYQELGERAKAVVAYDNVLAVAEDTDKDVRELKTKALRQALECWIKDGKYADAVARATPWLTKGRGAEEVEPDWLASKFFLATALEHQLTAGATANTQRTVQIAQARRFAQDVARVKGEYQSEAVTLLAQLTKAGADPDKKPEKAANSFEEANDRVTAMLDEISALSLQISLAESSKDPDQLKQVSEWKRQLAEKQGGTAQNVRQALALSKSDSSSKDVNKLRYTLAYLLFNQGDYYDAAVISEYVARHYPDFDLAQACGEIALKAYVRLYQISTQDKTKRDFEAGKIGSVANYLMTRWPTEPAAQEAVNWFLYLAVDRQQLDTATDLLDKLPADSPARSEAEIRIGRMLWSEYLKASRLKEERPPQAELDKQLAKAQAVLESGVKAAMQRDSATPGIVDGVHALVQIYLDTSQADKAIPLLEQEKIGPLTLVNADHPATQREGVPFEIYRSALRAYITAQPPRLDAAAKVMDRLEQTAGKDAKASETLTAVYMAMGRDLQRQMEELRTRKDTAGMRAIAQAVEAFLKRIAARDQAANFSTLNWVADTFYSLGMGFDSGDGEPSTQAKAYYRQAVQAYEKILEAVKKNSQFAPSPESLLGVRLRLAICRRGLGEPDEFKQAIAEFAEMLKENPKVRVVQAEAAKTYQAWGARDPQYFKLAILGSNPDRKTGENAIWGWARIANILHGQIRRPDFSAEQQAEYRNWFHEARYQMCVCRFRYALAEKDKAEQKRQFELTKTDIALTYQLYPDLGGKEWKPQYVALLKNVQKELGEKPEGLEAFDAQKNAAVTPQQREEIR